MPQIEDVMLDDGPPKGPGFEGIVDFFKSLYKLTQPTEEGREFAESVRSGPGIMELLSPDVASLPLMGLRSVGAVTNIARKPGFLRRILGDADPEIVNQALYRAGTKESRRAGREGYRRLTQHARETPDFAGHQALLNIPDELALARSRLFGAANLSQSDEGRMFMEVAELMGDMAPVEATKFADRSIIETLLETLPDVR